MNRRRFLIGTAGTAATGVAVLGYGRYIEPERIEFTERALPDRDGTPPSFTIAQVSDLHLSAIGEMHEAIAAEIALREPELLVLTGDSINDSTGLPVLAEFLALLPWAIPKFAIFGNWEHWGFVDPRELGRVYADANCDLLINRAVLRHTRHGVIRIAGLDDLIGGRPDVRATLGTEADLVYHVLLAHCPAQRDLLPFENNDVDVVLSGHTHGGQVQVLGRAPVRPRGSGRYLEGWYRDDGVPMYVSRGVGTSVLPIRLGARPEVTFFGPQTAQPSMRSGR